MPVSAPPHTHALRLDRLRPELVVSGLESTPERAMPARSQCAWPRDGLGARRRRRHPPRGCSGEPQRARDGRRRRCRPRTRDRGALSLELRMGALESACARSACRPAPVGRTGARRIPAGGPRTPGAGASSVPVAAVGGGAWPRPRRRSCVCAAVDAARARNKGTDVWPWEACEGLVGKNLTRYRS